MAVSATSGSICGRIAMVLRLTTGLNAANNDTGRTAYCGPTVLSAITGYPVSWIEALIHEQRADPATAREIIEGTSTVDVAEALAIFGFGMDKIEDFNTLERKNRPTVWTFMQRPRSVFSYYVLAVHKGRVGHWISLKGSKICDTYTGGKWVDACYGPNRGCRIMEVYQVKRISEFAPLGPLSEREAKPSALMPTASVAAQSGIEAAVNPWVTASAAVPRRTAAVKVSAGFEA